MPQSPDVAFPQRPALSPSPELGQCDGPGLAPPLGPGTDNPLLALPVPGTECLGQGLRLLPSGEPARPLQTPASYSMCAPQVSSSPLLSPWRARVGGGGLGRHRALHLAAAHRGLGPGVRAPAPRCV